MLNNFINVPEVANLFGVSPPTVYRWVKDEKLPPAITLGGIRWNRILFKKWLKENHNGIIIDDNTTLPIDTYNPVI